MKKNPNTNGNEALTEVKEIKTDKAYKVYTYSDGTTVNTKGVRGRPANKLANGSVITKIVQYVPLTQSAAKEVVEHVEGLVKREALLTYSDGTTLVAGRGKRRQTLENGAKLTSVLIRIPKETPKEQTSKKGNVVEIIMENAAEKKTILVYADGTEVVARQGRPAPFLNGHALTSVIRHVPAKKERVVKPKVVKEKKAKKIEEVVNVAPTIPTTIPGNIEVGKVYFHASNGAAIKVLELKDETHVLGELLLDGKLTVGTILNSNLRG